MATKTQAAREEIATVAEANGWIAKTQTDSERLYGVTEYRRPTGRRYIMIRFTVHGSVIEANNHRRRVSDTDKRAQVIALLEAK